MHERIESPPQHEAPLVSFRNLRAAALQLNTPATAEPPSYDIWGFRRVTTKSVGAAAAPSDEV